MTAASGPKAKALDCFRDTLADCTSFRTWVGASGDDAQAIALSRIHKRTTPPPEDGRVFGVDELRDLRPYAVIWCERFSTPKVAEPQTFGEEGEFTVHFVQDIAPSLEDDEAETLHVMDNLVGDVMSDMSALAATGGYLAVTGFESEDPGLGAPDEESAQGDIAWVEMTVRIG